MRKAVKKPSDEVASAFTVEGGKCPYLCVSVSVYSAFWFDSRIWEKMNLLKLRRDTRRACRRTNQWVESNGEYLLNFSCCCQAVKAVVISHMVTKRLLGASSIFSLSGVAGWALTCAQWQVLRSDADCLWYLWCTVNRTRVCFLLTQRHGVVSFSD